MKSKDRGLQAAKPTKSVVGVAGALIGAAAAMQIFTVPAAGTTCTTDAFFCWS